MPVRPRRLLGAASGALLVTRDRRRWLPVAKTGDDEQQTHGAARRSRVTSGTTLVHADLHNHTLISDGDGDPAMAFPSMQDAGLDVAALTDHAYTEEYAIGLEPGTWARTGQLADEFNQPGRFVAMRGFEWTHPYLGHVNAWFTEAFTDESDSGTLKPLYDWLVRSPVAQVSGVHRSVDGSPAVAGFNHPGREPGRFAEFGYLPEAREQMVSLEMFNRYDDFLFQGFAAGEPSPLVACLGAGWRTGLLGVTDEHGDDWGIPEGKGRAGLWVRRLSRRGVLEALRSRRFFATRVAGLRLDATLNGRPMGSSLHHRTGRMRLAVDVDRGPQWRGQKLQLQVLRTGDSVPEVAEVVECASGEVARFAVPVDIAEGDWVVVRVADPELVNDIPGPAGHAGNTFGLAYTSPWFLKP
jgi:hypothetical protein